MFRDRQRQEWPNRRLDPQEGRRRVWRKWFYDHLVAEYRRTINRPKPLIYMQSVTSYYSLGSRNVRGR